MENKKIIPIFLACDDNYVKFAMVTLKSIAENANKDYTYNCYILNTGISQDTINRTKGLLPDNFNLEFPDVTDYFESIKERLPIRHYYSKTTYFRFFIAEMFEQYDKAIYIDSDTVVLGDISEFYNHELNNNLVGACQEQAIVQTKVYGDYVEACPGVSRNEYFNAGLLLINSKLFREECMLDQFIDFLDLYNFVLIQDEDYLNVMCNKRVTWIDNSWNTEVYGEIKYKDEDINMIHYLMWSKPWHFDNIRLQEYFWKYAKMTCYYDDIKEVLANYTDEQRAKDLDNAKNLEKMAINEIERPDNYSKLLAAGKIKRKSIDRLQVQKKIRELEKAGIFDQDVEQDPPTKELLPEEIDYERKSVKSKIKTRYAYFIARKFLNKMVREDQIIIKEVKGIENIQGLDTGAILTCNHFNAFDSFAIQVAYEESIKTKKERKKKKFFRVIREGNYTSYSGFYGFLMRNCYTLPLSSNTKTMAKFMRSMNNLLKQGHLVLVYPEQSMWWNYRKPKPLKEGAYKFAVAANVPVVPCFITMKDTDKIGTDGYPIQEYTIHISKPIYPDPNKSKIDNVKYIMDENYRVWKDIYESVYHVKLEYTTQEARA
jgi:lipopolysaccharide biosynthesis glycosyltransferase